MTCRNCRALLETNNGYCPSCGARVIRNRLTFLNLWEDFNERFLNYDNTFLKTLIALCIRPEEVIAGYIAGVRKRYMDPLSYLGIALTLSGVQLFVTRKISDKIDWDIYNQGVNPELMNKLTDIMFDFSSLIFIVYIPVFAFAAWLVMNRQQFYFSETIVVFVYIMAQWSITLFLPSILFLLTAPAHYMQFSFPLLLLLLVYSIYSLQRIQRFPVIQLLWRAFVFIVMVLLGYIGIIALFYAILFATGIIELQDFNPV